MKDNRSEETEAEPPSESNGKQNQKELPFPYFLPIIQLTLRVLGIYIFLAGTSSCIEDAIVLFSEWSRSYDVYYLLITNPFTAGRLVGDMTYAAAGLYLVLGGQWVIENVFLPSDTE